MNKKIILKIFLALVLLTSCMDSEEDISSISPLNYTTWGFMSVTGGVHYIKTDTKKMLKLQEFDASSFKVKQGDRVYAEFRIVNEEGKDITNSATYTHLVKITELYVVDYNSITKVDDANRATIKNGYVGIKGVGVTATNLNLHIEHNKLDNKAHKVLLCYDSDVQTTVGPVQLDLKDSTEVSGIPTQTVARLQSYNITQLEELGAKNSEGGIEFIVVTNRGTAYQKEFNLVYQP